MFQPVDPSKSPRERLSPFDFVSALTRGGLTELERHSTPVSFQTGALLLDEGGTCDPLVLVEKGSIRVFKRSEGGREISLYRVDPGESCVLAMAVARWRCRACWARPATPPPPSSMKS